VHVFDDDEQRLALRGGLDELRQCKGAPALSSGGFHRALQRLQLRIQRRVRQIAQVDELIDAGIALREAADSVCSGLCRRVGVHPEQAQRQGRDGPAAGRLAKVEDLRAMGGDASILRRCAHSVRQARFTDAGFAANHDGAAVATAGAAIHHGESQRKLRTSAHEKLQ
jgi:hypothetical protein